MSRRCRGLTLIEVMLGFTVLIPLALAGVDIAAISNAAQINEQTAENVARAAAGQLTEDKAKLAAEDAAKNIELSSIITHVTVTKVAYDSQQGQVNVTVCMGVKFPIPFPGYSQTELKATAMQPIVATPAPQ